MRNFRRRDSTFEGVNHIAASIRRRKREKKNRRYWEEYVERSLKVMGFGKYDVDTQRWSCAHDQSLLFLRRRRDL